MVTPNLNRASYVVALLLGFLALVDAANGFIRDQNVYSTTGGAGWMVDVGAAAIGAGLLAALLIRPHLYVFGAVVAWCAVAFAANLALRSSGGLDSMATVRMTVYLVAGVVAVVLFAVAYVAAEADGAAAAGAQPAPPVPPVPPVVPAP
ncbi:MAG: hypothetical protein ABSA21_06640 [Candidatus Limnocylindrales bacterium]|jgi:hypothetical protein